MSSKDRTPYSIFGVTFGAGDFVSLFSLFFDNLSTLLGFAGAINGLAPGNKLAEEILYERIIPAAGLMLFLGNVYYTWQAIRMTKKYNKPYTAQPYGLNTAGGFPFIFGIMYGVFFSTEGQAIEDEGERFELAWRVCVSANFITGLMNIVLGFFGQFMLRYFPLAAMLVPLAGIGFTWLALNQITPNFAIPSIGFIPVFLIFTQYYAMGRIRVGRFYLPEALPIVIFGCAAGWWYGTQGDVVDPVSGGVWAGSAFIDGFQDIGPYMGTVLPFSIAASFTDMMCLVSAQKAGDPYPITETMVSDGIGTLIGSILGCPFGTVVSIFSFWHCGSTKVILSSCVTYSVPAVLILTHNWPFYSIFSIIGLYWTPCSQESWCANRIFRYERNYLFDFVFIRCRPYHFKFDPNHCHWPHHFYLWYNDL